MSLLHANLSHSEKILLVESPLIISCVLAEKNDNDLLVHVSLTKPVDVSEIEKRVLFFYRYCD